MCHFDRRDEDLLLLGLFFVNYVISITIWIESYFVVMMSIISIAYLIFDLRLCLAHFVIYAFVYYAHGACVQCVGHEVLSYVDDYFECLLFMFHHVIRDCWFYMMKCFSEKTCWWLCNREREVCIWLHEREDE